MSIHSCSLGAPIPLEEEEAAGVKPAPKGAAAARMLASNDLAQRRRLGTAKTTTMTGTMEAFTKVDLRTLRRSLWRALRRPSRWVAGCRHMPLLLMCGSSASCPSRHGLFAKATR
jgi:hypothetical protein